MDKELLQRLLSKTNFSMNIEGFMNTPDSETVTAVEYHFADAQLIRLVRAVAEECTQHLLQMHEQAGGRHNYYHCAANEIRAKFGSS